MTSSQLNTCIVLIIAQLVGSCSLSGESQKILIQSQGCVCVCDVSLKVLFLDVP